MYVGCEVWVVGEGERDAHGKKLNGAGGREVVGCRLSVDRKESAGSKLSALGCGKQPSGLDLSCGSGSILLWWIRIGVGHFVPSSFFRVHSILQLRNAALAIPSPKPVWRVVQKAHRPVLVHEDPRPFRLSEALFNGHSRAGPHGRR